MDDLLAQFEFPLLVEALRSKYGALPDGWAASNGAVAPEQQQQEHQAAAGKDTADEEPGSSPPAPTSLPANGGPSATASALLGAAPRRFSTADSSDDDDAEGEMLPSPGLPHLMLTQSHHAKRGAGPDAALLHRQLVTFYEMREPAKAQVAKRLLTNHSLTELQRALFAKYGSLPEGWEHIVEATPNHSPGGSTSSSACSSPTWKDSSKRGLASSSSSSS